MKLRHTIYERTIFMSNPKITSENYNTEQTLLPLSIEEEAVVHKKAASPPTFIPYNNQQQL